jgi:trk system potassium uptake protein TrkH
VHLAVVVHTMGTLVGLFGPALLVPAAVAALYAEWRDAATFAVTFAVSAIVGLAMRRAGGPGAGDVERLRRVEGLAIVSGTWLIIAHIAAVPYIAAGLPFVDALFESMSGLTTTGATVLTDFSTLGRGMFFWRALTQWLGGVGVIALFIAVLPRLAIGGRELFFAEAAGPTDEKLTPQLRKTAIALWQLYGALTIAETAALALAGMSPYDAVVHSLTTMAAGGFSPHPLSIAGYASPAVDWIVTAFMFAAGANFALQYRAVRGNRVAIGQDEEFRAYAGLVVVASLAVTALLMRDGTAPLEALRHATFQVTSILTTTGYASADFQLWSDQAKFVLLLLMFVGGCAGSAAGGPKVVRHILMARLTLRELKRALHPRGILPVKLGKRVVPEHILRDVQVFMLLYLLTFAVTTTVVVALGADLVTGLTASIACLGNIGPGFNDVGPMASFGPLPPASKIVLTLAMWIGRLEVIAVLVFIRIEPWRSARWGATHGTVSQRA